MESSTSVSIGGRLNLVNSVLTVIPTYWMSILDSQVKKLTDLEEIFYSLVQIFDRAVGWFVVRIYVVLVIKRVGVF